MTIGLGSQHPTAKLASDTGERHGIIQRMLIMTGECQRCERCPVADRELPKNVMQMNFNGPIGNTQLASNLFVRPSLGYQVHDLAFALGQDDEQVRAHASAP